MPLKNMNVIMIDNYDSFTFNLVQYLQELKATVKTYRNDQITSSEVINANPDFIILSPGPSTPDHAGICLELIEQAASNKVPLFGVCLGHQSIAQVFGAKIVKCAVPMHGKTSAIKHHNTGVFKNLPNPLTATRYHSLTVENKNIPEHLEVTATSEDGTIMGIRHKESLIEGVQFHPESVLSECGHELIKNFALQI